ncbi:hypothetical protein [Couchioplanes caeruleus]|uniref:Lipoprotein n=2 Tax=Couchioplanes caeruleus TaxID=56438 RepID=A0A1K0F9Z3_9ACTN|nr:hypothetical protein [Couchioplanes caeruleus]OJF09657.1 hypothetical protein BG844_36435 [Couchioplanes caeruleus subsp. caeruleus]ROP31955.1 hypothetical protein EDD30_4883 [Couchioplanes caeruleus]
MNRRFAAVLVPLLALSLAACTGDDDKPADPKAALVASTSGLKGGDYSFTASLPGDSVAKGTVHTPSKTASLDFDSVEEGAKAKMQFRITDPDRYVKMTIDMSEAVKQAESLAALGDDPQSAKVIEGLKAMIELFSGKQWLKLDMAKVTNDDFKIGIEDPDLTGAAGLFGGVTTAERKGPVITGTLDATVVKDDAHLLGTSVFKGAEPAQAKAIPYEATLDVDGRLTKLVLDVPKTTDAPAGKLTMEVSGYGAAAKQDAPPAAETKEMPESAYEMINGKN